MASSDQSCSSSVEAHGGDSEVAVGVRLLRRSSPAALNLRRHNRAALLPSAAARGAGVALEGGALTGGGVLAGLALLAAAELAGDGVHGDQGAAALHPPDRTPGQAKTGLQI